MTPEEIAFAEEAIELVEQGQKDLLLNSQVDALLTAARYGVKVANNIRKRGPRLVPRVWRGYGN